MEWKHLVTMSQAYLAISKICIQLESHLTDGEQIFTSHFRSSAET
jgi:hypothetical protein